jgi:phage regulator Rha-like protein
MEIIKFDEVQDKVIIIRDENVILDSDLADLYEVETRDINKAVKNNPDKFPDGYIFELTKSEKSEVVEIFHHLEKIRFSPHLPKAFTEKGIYMLATILKSKKATQTTISIIETFSRLKNFSRTI